MSGRVMSELLESRRGKAIDLAGLGANGSPDILEYRVKVICLGDDFNITKLST